MAKKDGNINGENVVKRTVKDFVFTDFFRMLSNLLELYKVLHPEDIALDVKVKVLYGADEDDVVSQYVTFAKVYDEQR